MAQISYTNKVALNENPEILDINKVTDDDMNEIKQVVNDNYNNTIQITDTEPTDSDNKIWIDTGEVQSIGSEVSVGTTQPTNGEKVWFKTSKNLFDYSKSINGYISATGEFNTSNTNMLSDYIETESNKQYIASTYTNVYGINIAEFDSSKAFIKRTMSSSNVKENSITTSSTTKYIRVWFNIDNSTTMNINSLTNIKAQILYGDIATTYEPYINKQIYTNQNGYYNEFYSENNTTKYSTNEIRIGTWMGKPLYRCVISTTTTTAGTEKRTDISNLNVDKLILNGFINTGSLSLPLNAYISSSNYIITYQNITSNEIRTTVTDSSYANKELVYILEYTKTTD